MRTEEAVRRWIEAWERGWPARDVDAIAGRYRDDAPYRSHPFREVDTARSYLERAFGEEDLVEARFGEPVVAGERAAVEYWAVLRSPTEGDVTIAGASLLRFDDGRLNVAVEGRERFRILAETGGRSFLTAEVEALDDEAAAPDSRSRERALELFRKLERAVDTEVEEPSADSALLSFELASRVDFGPERKQELLELRSESERLRVVCDLLERAAEAITLERALADSASKNGRGLRHG